MKKKVFSFYGFFLIFELVESLQISFGDCPIFYEEPCNPNIVKFILSANGTNPYLLNPFQVTLPDTLNSRIPFKVIIHGYGGLNLDKALTRIRDSYHEVGYNVILVDWGPLAEVPCYATAFINTWHVGQCIAILTVSLIPLGIKPNDLHFIGFSLGAHIAGFAGANIKKNLRTLPGRITGLDPALPLFATLNNEWKLDTSDANFVDIVHTSSGSFGKIEALGHVDFYMNGGVLQPACYDAPYPPLCSHVMSGFYFAESITSDTLFVGIQCDNIANYAFGFCQGRPKAIMGEFLDKKIRGSYYVLTSNSTPFAMGDFYDNLIF